ncbi:hypothetical protein [Rhodococcus jostii]|uniref:hypothetical protein n=1 Tax=Rhodococcus jostii TaxID=132919 RepID=UPI0036682DD3
MSLILERFIADLVRPDRGADRFMQIDNAPPFRVSGFAAISGKKRVLECGIAVPLPRRETAEVTHRRPPIEPPKIEDGDRGQVADRQYRTMDTEAVEFLQRCAERTGTTWRVPVSIVARSALAGLDGLALRWLVDRNTDALITGLDDLIAMITVKAIASPIDATPAVRPISRA